MNLISKTFFHFSEDSEYIYQIVNKVPDFVLREVYEYYLKKSEHYKYERVVKTRLLLIRQLLDGKVLDENMVEKTKKLIVKRAIANNYKKDIFHSWSPNWRILFPIYYEQYREDVIVFLNELAIKISEDLRIENCIDINVVDFNGATNFGNPCCWIAIYNRSHSTQKTALQLYFSIMNGQISYGLFKYKFENNLVVENIRNFNYENILNEYKKYTKLIKADISKRSERSGYKGRTGKLIVNVDDYFRKSNMGTRVEQKHKKIQNILSESLRDIYGSTAEVILEKDFIDIKVEGKDFIDIYEIKTSDSAINCVRNAIGQLLLYASRLKNVSNKKIKLIVVGLGKDNLDLNNFKRFLWDNFSFEFTYRPYLEIK